MPTNWNGLLPLVASIGTSRAEHTTFYMSYQQIKTLLLLTTRQCIQWKFIYIHTEIVCHWSLLMSLALAEHSIHLLTCHLSRWRLCHHSPQDNQSKSWKRCDLCLFCHWSLLMLLAPAGQSIQLFICHISRRRLCHRSPQDNQSKSRKKVWPLVLLLLGMVPMTPGNSLWPVYIRLGISYKA